MTDAGSSAMPPLRPYNCFGLESSYAMLVEIVCLACTFSANARCNTFSIGFGNTRLVEDLRLNTWQRRTALLLARTVGSEWACRQKATRSIENPASIASSRRREPAPQPHSTGQPNSSLKI